MKFELRLIMLHVMCLYMFEHCENFPAGDYLIPLRMINPNGEQSGFMLSILPIKPSIDANAEDGA